MNVHDVYATLANALVRNVGSAATTGTPSPSSSQPTTKDAATSTTISTPAQFFSQMQQLAQQDPAEFKTVAAQVATTFQSAATQASGPQAMILSNLASQFNQAAETGTLQPPRGSSTNQTGQAAQGAEAGQASQTGQTAPLARSGRTGGSRHHHPQGGGGSTMSSEVQQAFQNAMAVFTNATQGTPPATAA
jgi:hypothetical protein